MQAKQLIIVSGVSGSGKSTVLNALEDLGFFCVDNLPIPLLPGFVKYLGNLPDAASSCDACSCVQRGHAERFALLVDCRDAAAFSAIEKAAAALRKTSTEVTVIFLDCHDDVVQRRFRETRRPHPLSVGCGEVDTVREALACERDMLAGLRQLADKIIDTSSFTPHELRRLVEDYIGGEPAQLEIAVRSFGFKYGVPHDLDLLVDVRFLPNPHFVPQLRERTGEDDDVRDYVFGTDEAAGFVDRYSELLAFLIPKYQREGKRYLTIGVGCTGGKHRSVAVSRALAERVDSSGIQLSLHHRDKDRVN